MQGRPECWNTRDGHGVTRLIVQLQVAVVPINRATRDADWPPDNTILLDLDPRVVLHPCEPIGTDVRPDWSQRGSRPSSGSAHTR